MFPSFIQLPYVMVSREDYEWLIYSRLALIASLIVCGLALWDKRRNVSPQITEKTE